MCRELSTQERALLSKGLPETVKEYESGKLDIAGTVFTSAPKRRGPPSLEHYAGSVFMAIRKPSEGEVWFGVIRKILEIPRCGCAAGSSDTVIWADWFQQIATNAQDLIRARTHKRLQVPMVMTCFDTNQDKLFDARRVAPVHLTLVPGLDGAARYWVLSRDAKVWELAHPMWGPDPKGALGLKYRVERRDK